MSLLECNRVEKRTKVHKLDPPGTLIWPPCLSPMVRVRWGVRTIFGPNVERC